MLDVGFFLFMAQRHFWESGMPQIRTEQPEIRIWTERLCKQNTSSFSIFRVPTKAKTQNYTRLVEHHHMQPQLKTTIAPSHAEGVKVQLQIPAWKKFPPSPCRIPRSLKSPVGGSLVLIGQVEDLRHQDVGHLVIHLIRLMWLPLHQQNGDSRDPL